MTFHMYRKCAKNIRVFGKPYWAACVPRPVLGAFSLRLFILHFMSNNQNLGHVNTPTNYLDQRFAFLFREKLANHIHDRVIHQQTCQHLVNHRDKLKLLFTGRTKPSPTTVPSTFCLQNRSSGPSRITTSVASPSSGH